MRTLTILVTLAVLVGVVTAVVAMVFRVDTGTWNLVATLSALALFVLALGLAFGGAANLYLRGRAKLEEARALGMAADARRIHGIPQPAPTYNTTVNMLVMRNANTGDVRYLPQNDPARAGSMMQKYAMQGYVLDLEPR